MNGSPRPRARQAPHGRRRDRLRGDAEFAVQHLGRRRGAEAASCRRIRRRRRASAPSRPRPPPRRRPAARARAPSSRYSRGCWRNRSKHGAETTAARTSVAGEQLGRVQRDRHFRTGRDQGDVAAAFRLDHDIGAAARPGCRRRSPARNVGIACRDRHSTDGLVCDRSAQSHASAVSTASPGRNTSRLGMARSDGEMLDRLMGRAVFAQSD